jgi:hypothetical protein
MYIAEKIRKKKEASSSHLESSSQTFQAADIPKKRKEKLDPFFLFVLLDIPSSFFSFSYNTTNVRVWLCLVCVSLSSLRVLGSKIFSPSRSSSMYLHTYYI